MCYCKRYKVVRKISKFLKLYRKHLKNLPIFCSILLTHKKISFTFLNLSISSGTKVCKFDNGEKKMLQTLFEKTHFIVKICSKTKLSPLEDISSSCRI